MTDEHDPLDYSNEDDVDVNVDSTDAHARGEDNNSEEPAGLGSRALAAVTSGKAKGLYFTVVVAAVTLGVGYASWVFAGPVDTVLYFFLFGFGAVLIPATVGLGSPSFTRGMRSIFGKLHFIQGQIAFNGGFLLELDNKWVMCPTRDTPDGVEFHHDGEWHGPVSGMENMSMLGWQRFGVLRFKDEETFRSVRENPNSLQLADGGESKIVRGGVPEALPQDADVGRDEWLFDIKKVWSKGLQKMGDIDLIEKAEEVAMRNQAKEGRMSGWETTISVVIGLVLGSGTAYMLL